MTLKDTLLPEKETYFGAWESGSPRWQMAHDFEVNLAEDVVVLFANYDCGCYDGSAWVLYALDGRLYTVHGNHCSCYGLEGQWSPEPVTVAEVRELLRRHVGGQYHVDAILPEAVERALAAWEALATPPDASL